MHEKITKSFPHTNLEYFTFNWLVNHIQSILQSTRCKKYYTNACWWIKEKCDSIKKPAAQNRRYMSLNRVLTLIQCIQNNNCQKFTLHSPSQWWNCNALEQRMESSRAFGVKSLSLDTFLCALFSHYWTALWKMSELHLNILSDGNPDSRQIAFLLWTVCYKKTWFNDSFTSSSGPWHSSMV